MATAKGGPVEKAVSKVGTMVGSRTVRYGSHTSWVSQLATLCLCLCAILKFPAVSAVPTSLGTTRTSKSFPVPSSFLYIIGCAKDVSMHLPKVRKNIDIVKNLFIDYKVFVYSDSLSMPAFTEWHARDPKVTVIAENFQHPSRTTRLAHGRNLLLQQVHTDINKTDSGDSQSLENVFIVMIDFDDVNARPFNRTTVKNALIQRNRWDVVSFNRFYYYDIWALRYDRFNINVWNFGAQSTVLRDVIEADLTSQLNPHQTHLFPVVSAFNGIAFYRASVTFPCSNAYSGSNSETQLFATHTAYNHTRASIPEECEHVSFHRCLVSKSKARVRIFSGII
jgi:hypothetical protein